MGRGPKGLRPLYTVLGRAVSFISSIAIGVAFALPHPDKPCSYHQRGGRLFDGLGLRLYNACIVGRVGLGHHPPTRPSLLLPHFYCGHAFLTPLLAWVRLSYPTSSVALRFVPPLRCAGASVVRPCPSPVGRAQSSFPSVATTSSCSAHRLLS